MRGSGIIGACFCVFGVLPVGALQLHASPCGPATVTGVFVLAEGDSITFGQGAKDGRSYVQRTCALSDGHVAFADAARSRAILGGPGDGAGVNSLYGRLEDDARLMFERRAGHKVVVTVLIGRNDLVGYGSGPAGYADDLVRYVAAMRGAGADRVVVGTLLPSDWAPFTALRGSLNAILLQPGWAVAHGIDAVADFAASPVMGPDEAARNKALYVDGTHPTDRGYELLAPIYEAALAKASRGLR